MSNYKTKQFIRIVASIGSLFCGWILWTNPVLELNIWIRAVESTVLLVAGVATIYYVGESDGVIEEYERREVS